jgi:hypothetical protein
MAKSSMHSHPLNGVHTPPKFEDASNRPKLSPSVNSESTRSGVAKTPKTLGGRTA